MNHKIHIRLEHDEDTENPFDYDGAWRMVFFSDRYRDSRSPDDPEFHTIGFRRKLEVGTAFVLDCYEHSGVSWSLQGEGMSCPWDTSGGAGLLICDKPSEIVGDRRQSARQMLDVYNAWANGSCLYFSVDVTEVDGEEVDIPLDSCGGFIMVDQQDEEYVMNDYIVPTILSYLENDPEPEIEIEVSGVMDYLFDADDVEAALEKAQTAKEPVAA